MVAPDIYPHTPKVLKLSCFSSYRLSDTDTRTDPFMMSFPSSFPPSVMAPRLCTRDYKKQLHWITSENDIFNSNWFEVNWQCERVHFKNVYVLCTKVTKFFIKQKVFMQLSESTYWFRYLSSHNDGNGLIYIFFRQCFSWMLLVILNQLLGANGGAVPPTSLLNSLCLQVQGSSLSQPHCDTRKTWFSIKDGFKSFEQECAYFVCACL